MTVWRDVLRPVVRVYRDLKLPESVKAERTKDRQGLPAQDPGLERAVDQALAWLARAQDHSRSQDGGVARHFSLIDGWSPSYPETTGYIVPTMLSCAASREDGQLRDRARRMLDWLVSIQLSDGAFQAGRADRVPPVPTTFNTGQILMGLAHGVQEFGEVYREPMCRAADWLVNTQDADGCWRKHPSPYTKPGEKTYETHVAWGLLEAARIDRERGYVEAALANVRWALTHQQDNGWFDRCCLTDPSQPLTHTLGYVLRGVVEAYRFTQDAHLFQRCRRTADGLLTVIREDGFLPGRLRADWSAAAPWACLTGTVQIAHCWLMLHKDTHDARYLDAASTANRYVRRTMNVDGPPETRGAIKGSFPVDGDYAPYQYLNWACKFFIDSSLLEKAVRQA